MPIPLVLAALCLQTPAPKAPTIYSLSLPPGLHEEAIRAFQGVGSLAQSLNYAEAKKGFAKLPSAELVVGWDDTKVPELLRPSLAATRTKVLDQLKRNLPQLILKVARRSTQLQISFEHVLADNSDKGIPRGIAEFWGSGSKEPRLEAVIGLYRGQPLQPSTADDFSNEILYSIGRYFGLSSPGFQASVMTRQDEPYPSERKLDSGELFSIKAITEVSHNLKTAILQQRQVVAGIPKLVVSTATIDAGTVYQGEDAQASVLLTNVGTGAASFMARGNCGCMVLESGNVIAPGQSYLMRASITTREAAGNFSREITLYTNDAEKPFVVVPIELRVRPRFIMTSSIGREVTVEDGKPIDYRVTMRFAEGAKPLQVSSARMAGLKASVTAATDRDAAGKLIGYTFDVHVEQVNPNGRFVSQLLAKTDDPKMPVVDHQLTLQVGMITLPTELFVGSVPRMPRPYKIEVTQPGKPFKVLSATSSLPDLDVRVEALADIGYRILVQRSKLSHPGPFEGIIIIKTDNPKKPVIEVPVSGEFLP